ncbi:hypothetical protein K492DRAFT_190461 [Lichtheimia hyalospora FSU 10163]|nr:hypothetical protein K492DRAFT_190461 [Lichtheimia hyalospora FSU 10163]
MRFSLSLSIAILAIFATVQAKESEATDGEKNQVQAQSKFSIPPDCLGAQGEIIQECLDNADIDGPDGEGIEVGEE